MFNKFAVFLEDVPKWINSVSPADVIYHVFQKAFDNIPHQRLLLKLNSHATGHEMANWIMNMLQGRRSRV